jgi:uncharacterized protein
MNFTILHSSGYGSRGSYQNMERGQCDCNCDCACVPVPALFRILPTSSSLWRKADDLFMLPLSSNYKLFVFPRGNGQTLLNSHTCKVLDWFTEPRSLSTLASVEAINASRQLAVLGLLLPASDNNTLNLMMAGERPDPTLTAWFHLTDRCNLRCSYCYLPHARDDMSNETGRSAVDAIFRSARAGSSGQVKIKYAGGEPLLRYPLILELHAYARSLAEKHNIGLQEVVLSNGTLLTGEIARDLKSLGIQLMISLDGYGSYHDSHRPYAGGRSSFQDVADAVETAVKNGLVPTISVTISSRTAEGLPKIMKWILDRDLPFSLNFYRENELSASHEGMRLDEEKIINGMLAAFKIIEINLPRRSFLGGIVDRVNLSFAHIHACGVGRNYLVFDQHGRVAKCQMNMGKPVTDLEVSDPLAVLRTDQTGLQNIPVDDKEGCKSCEWKYWCAGGCPLETYRATGRYDVKSPNCNIYKALYPEALRLEGLRLLKYQDDPEVVIKY